MSPFARRVATSVLRSRHVSRALRSLASFRGHALVLVYHRIGPTLEAGCEIVPSVPEDLFRRHLQTLGNIVDLVSLAEIAGERRRRGELTRRPAVALTFDDDLPSHVQHALGILTEYRVPAAFFLSGRALHGLGPYWFQHLETLLIAHGQRRVATLLGVPECRAEDLMRRCERDAELRRRITELAADAAASPILAAEGIAALATAGMTIGFHTVDHPVLPGLDQATVARAVSHGRGDLEGVAGSPVRYFAYPHGKADSKTAAAVRQAGFIAGFTGRAEPVRIGGDPYRLGRWEPGRVGIDELLVKLALRLHAAASTRHAG